MVQKRILILDGHPAERSLSQLFTSTYAKVAMAAGHEVRTHHLSQMEFDTDFGDGGYKRSKPLEEQLQAFSDDLQWCNHFVFAAPMWWGGLPAKLKGLFDRVLLPGVAFSTREKTALGLPKPLLMGRSARVIFTADTPSLFERLFYHRAVIHQTRGQITKFIGMSPTRFTWFAPATEATSKKIEKWTYKISRLGAQAT